MSQQTEREFLYLIHQTTCLIDKTIDASLLRAGQISFSQFLILMSLKHTPGSSQQELAKFLDITPAAISRQIHTLSKLGYLKQKISPGNKRMKILTNTPLGEAQYQKAVEIIDNELALLRNEMPEERLQQMNTTLRIILTLLHGDTCPITKNDSLDRMIE